MMKKTCYALCVTSLLAAGASANLITNGGFEDSNTDGDFGDGWGTFGAAAVNFEFFPNGNPGHATLFADNTSNFGGVFQQGILGTEGVEYTFSVDGQFESEWDARQRFGLEFYQGDDATLISAALVEITDDSAVAGQGYMTYMMSAVAPAGTVFVRPIILFDQVLSGGGSRASTWDNATLIPAPGALAVLGLGGFAVRRRR
ncbi:MAG: hypothetical protein AAGG07_14380 [Planctomycetota bacterium]